MKHLLLFLAICICCAKPSSAEMKIGNTTLAFATIDEGRQVLTARDDYVRRMSPFDFSARLKTDRDVSEVEYLAFVAENVVAWDDAAREKVAAALEGVQPALEALSLPLPPRVLLITTTGHEEGHAAYTRGDAIVLPEKVLTAPLDMLQRMICHELFHILSRHHPKLREQLYEVVGFERCGEVDLPPALRSRKITNPDAPRNEHCIRVKVEEEQCWAVPILFSTHEKYDVERGGEFFDYLQFRMLLIDRDSDSGNAMPIGDDQPARLVDVREISGFYEQVGHNTAYIIHPEEILADNFAMLVLGERNLTSPEIVEKIEAVLREATAAKPVDSTHRE